MYFTSEPVPVLTTNTVALSTEIVLSASTTGLPFLVTSLASFQVFTAAEPAPVLTAVISYLPLLSIL